MDDNLTSVLIVTISVLGPIWIIFHYKAKGRIAGALSANETAMLETIGQTAQRLEQRVATLEHILDSEVPAWRSTLDPGQYGRQAG